MTPADRHLTELELVLAASEPDRLPPSATAHLGGGCEECRDDIADLASLAAPVATATGAVPVTQRPEASAPTKGELWRVCRDDVAELAFVWSGPRPWIRAFPATTDVDYADDQTALLDAADTTIGLGLGIWCGLGVDLSVDLFVRKVGSASPSAVAAVAAVHRSITRQEIIEGVLVGVPVVSRIDERFEYRAVLGDRFTSLADAVLPSDEADLPDQYSTAAARAAAVGRDERDRLRGDRGHSA